MQELFMKIIQSFEFEAFMRLLLGALLSGIIGYERQAWKKPAGLRTHVLVGESAVLIMLCGLFLAKQNEGTDPSRIPAQLLSGIGFIGAGTILREGFQVKGLTTAASLLAVTGIGLIVGAGAYVVGILATLIVYIILSYTHVLSDAMEKFDEFDLKIYIDDPKENMKEIEKIFSREYILLKSIKTNEDYVEVKGKLSGKVSKGKLLTSIMKIENVTEVVDK